MMTQGELRFKYEVDHQGGGMTGMGGIGPYLDLACRSGMVKSIERHVKEAGDKSAGSGICCEEGGSIRKRAGPYPATLNLFIYERYILDGRKETLPHIA
jgi:hypothetical protein